MTASRKPLSIAAIGCGSRTRTYLQLAMSRTGEFSIAAAADPIATRVETVRSLAPEEEQINVKTFSDAMDLLAEKKLADIAMIGTQDDFHYEPCKKALELGYDVLLEKPISNTLHETLKLRDLAISLNRRVAICHVLRYAPFYKSLKRIIESGEIGEVMTFNANEGVGAWHFAHSFVRGHWRNSADSSPMVVAKCCHDMDLIYWLFQRKCRRVSSFGQLSFFTKASLAHPRPQRCTDWTEPVGEDPWDARQYATEADCRGWLGMVYDNAKNATEDEIYEWLKTSPWGRDHFQCDNNQPDHQVVILELEKGITGTFTMTAFEEGRHMEIYGTKGKIRAGYFYKQHGPGEITVEPHFGGKDKLRVVRIEESASEKAYGHSGGDWGLVKSLYSDMTAAVNSMTTSISDSVHSHVVAFAIEHARLSGTVVDVERFETDVVNGKLTY